MTTSTLADPIALLVPGTLVAAWWAASPENRGQREMPGGWFALFTKMEREAFAAIAARAQPVRAALMDGPSGAEFHSGAIRTCQPDLTDPDPRTDPNGWSA